MKLATTRDTAIIGAAIAVAVGVAYALADDFTPGRFQPKPAAPVRRMPEGLHFDLCRIDPHVGDDHGRSTYSRPASEAERTSSQAARLIDGVGVFGVNRDGQHVLPGTPEWDLALADNYDARLTYYRVG